MAHPNSQAEWRPELIDRTTHDGEQRWQELSRGNQQVATAVDTIYDQLAELVRTRHPAQQMRPDEIDDEIRVIVGGCDRQCYGVWCHYPWRRELVHILPAALFRELRSDRNRNQITNDEQAELRTRVVAIVGLSVGQTIAATLALEGVGGEFRLADPDRVSLSNLNRMRCPLADIGINKAVLAARQLFEIDPYLAVRVYPEGVKEESLAELLGEPSRVDVLVEECDDLRMKFILRHECRRMRIPVVMHTSDRGMLDVERFDEEPARPLFHGRLHDVGADDLRALAPAERIAMVMRLLDAEQMSPRALASLREIGRTLTTWPQLGSAVVRGGSTVTAAVRRVLLGHAQPSGRTYDNLD